MTEIIDNLREEQDLSSWWLRSVITMMILGFAVYALLTVLAYLHAHYIHIVSRILVALDQFIHTWYLAYLLLGLITAGITCRERTTS